MEKSKLNIANPIKNVQIGDAVIVEIDGRELRAVQPSGQWIDEVFPIYNKIGVEAIKWLRKQDRNLQIKEKNECKNAFHVPGNERIDNF